MTKARDIMSPSAEWIDVDLTVTDAARKMADLDVGALPVCDGEGHLQGMVTDRDIVVKVLAAGKDPVGTTMAEFATQGEVVTIGADDSVEDAIATMKKHAVRRLPVIDGQTLVGMVSQADLAMSTTEKKAGDLVEAISSAPPNN